VAGCEQLNRSLHDAYAQRGTDLDHAAVHFYRLTGMRFTTGPNRATEPPLGPDLRCPQATREARWTPRL
jgi:hypothetical protein